MSDASHSDVAFAVFVSTRNVAAVKRERFVEAIPTTLTRRYDNETEQQRLLIRNRADKKVSK